MLWMNANRESIKKKNPEMGMTDIGRKAGEIWRTLSSADKKEWEDKQKKAKEKYDIEIAEWRKTHGDSHKSKSKKSSKSSSSSKPSKPSSSPKKKVSDVGGTGGGFKSKEFISDSDSDSGSDSDGKKSKSKGKKSKPAKGKDAKKGKGKEPVKVRANFHPINIYITIICHELILKYLHTC